MEIRKTLLSDLPRVMRIFEIARNFMRRTGNPTQWSGNYPSEQLIVADIQRGVSYVVVDDGEIAGTFVFIEGDEPTYAEIDGSWLNDKPYGTIHRIASAGTTKGIADECLKFCKSRTRNIRIDTHKDNMVMQSWITRSGFKRCGIIRVSDGTLRDAFQLESGI